MGVFLVNIYFRIQLLNYKDNYKIHTSTKYLYLSLQNGIFKVGFTQAIKILLTIIFFDFKSKNLLTIFEENHTKNTNLYIKVQNNSNRATGPLKIYRKNQ